MTLERLHHFYRRPREIKAVALLQCQESYPGLAPWEEHHTRVRFVRLPCFRPYSVWTLQYNDHLCQVRRIEWDHVADCRAADSLPDSSPTIYGADAQFPRSAAQEILDQLTTLSLPPFLPVSTLGTDGVSFEVIFGDSWRSARLSWWGDPPLEWQPLVRCYDEAISRFERHLPLSTAQNPYLQTGA